MLCIRFILVLYLVDTRTAMQVNNLLSGMQLFFSYLKNIYT